MSVITEQQTTTATYSRRTLSIYLGRSVPALDRDAARGLLPAPIRLGGAVKWLKSEIDAWLEAGAPDRETWERLKAASKRGVKAS